MNIGFIGAGNMARAIIGGILAEEVVEASDVIASAPSEETRKAVADQFGIQTTPHNIEVAQTSDVVVLAVKPFVLADVIAEIKDAASEDTLFISIAAGKPLGWIEDQFGMSIKLVRAMPNTPALVGEGVTGLCPNTSVSTLDMQTVRSIFTSVGTAYEVDEHMIDVMGAIAGSSPAFVFMFVEALADAAVAEGMPRTRAYAIASQAVLGSAQMVRDTGKHPGELKDMVCSPAGTTIEGVQVLEEEGLRAAVMDATRAVMRKTREL